MSGASPTVDAGNVVDTGVPTVSLKSGPVALPNSGQPLFLLPSTFADPKLVKIWLPKFRIAFSPSASRIDPPFSDSALAPMLIPSESVSFA